MIKSPARAKKTKGQYLLVFTPKDTRYLRLLDNKFKASPFLFYLQAFAQMNSNLAPLKDGCRENKRQWQKLADEHKAEVL